MEIPEIFYRLSTSLAIGLMIGIERGWVTRGEAEGGRAAGLRTFTLSALLGGVTAALAQELSNGATLLGLVFVAFAAIVAVFRYREMAEEKTFGATTIIAACLTFALGAFAVIGEPIAAAAAAVAATALLALKPVLHAWLGRITWQELRAALILLAMTLIFLPLLPNREMGPAGAINPYELWLMTILIAAVSAAGYVAMKLSGDDRGVAVSGIAGGLVSSTAVTISFARLAREEPDRREAFVAGALFASATMMARILILVGSINAALLPWMIAPLSAAGLALAAVAAWHLSHNSANNGEPALTVKNPFEIGTVLKFGIVLAAIMAAAKVLTAWTGERSIYGLAALSGIADTDAIALTLSRLAGSQIAIETAVAGILIATVVNTIVKTVWGWSAGGAKVGRPLAIGALIAGIAALAGFALVQLLDPFAAFAPHPVHT